MYPTPEVTAFIDEHFIPVRVHVKENPTAWHRFGVRWTPTVLVRSPDGKDVRRMEGFLPADDLLGQLELALGYEAANRKDWKSAEHWFAAASRRTDTDAGPEGLYWEGVAQYSASHDANVLKELNRKILDKYPDSSWSRRSSVWG